MMSRKIVLLSLTMLLIPIISQAQLGQTIPKPRIKTVGVLGRGLAISPTDLMDFKIVKIGVLRVAVSVLGEEKEIVRGMIFLDGERYLIKDINLTNEFFSGNLYQNETKKGNIELTLVVKNNEVVWVGTLTIEGSTYNTYILEAPRLPKREEIREQVREFCEAYPEKCKEKIRGIGPNYCNKTFDRSCREKIAEFCEEHPEDSRCKALRLAFCMAHTDDTRCREWIKEFCKENPESSVCKAFRVRATRRFCKKNPLSRYCVEIEKERIIDYCTQNPDDSKCAQIKRTREFLQKAYLARYCSQHPEEEKCEEFCSAYPLVCKRIPSTLSKIAEEANVTGGIG